MNPVRAVLGLALILFSSVLVACSDGSSSADAGDSKRLVINSFGGAWNEAIELGLIRAFEQETGIEVELLSTVDAAKSKLAIERGNEPPEDILDTDYAGAVALERDDLVAPIEYDGFDQKVLAELPEAAKPRFALGWGQFAMGICWDKRRYGDREPQGWADFFDVEKFPGKRGMIEWPVKPLPELGLLAEGVAPSDVYPVDIDRAFEKLEELRPHVPKFSKDPAALQQQLLDGEVAMEACYTHRVQKLVDAGAAHIGISYDQARLNNEYFVVWKNAPNKENAMKFLDFILAAKPQADWARIAGAGPINPDAYDHIPAEIQAKLPTAPAHRDKQFDIDDAWFAEQNADGVTNHELIVERWGDAVSSQ